MSSSAAANCPRWTVVQLLSRAYSAKTSGLLFGSSWDGCSASKTTAASRPATKDRPDAEGDALVHELLPRRRRVHSRLAPPEIGNAPRGAGPQS